jgi:hypothetical protein
MDYEFDSSTKEEETRQIYQGICRIPNVWRSILGCLSTFNVKHILM